MKRNEGALRIVFRMHTRTIVASVLILGSAGLLLKALLSGGEVSALTFTARAGRASPSVLFQASLPAAMAQGGVTGSPEGAAVQGITNLTDLLSRNYLSQVAGNNTSGLSAEGMTLPGQGALQELLGNAVAQTFTFTPLTERDIRIGTDASPAAERMYLEAVDQALHARFDGVGKSAFDALQELGKGNTATFELLAGRASAYVGDLLALRPPPALASTHLAWVNLWKKKVAVYQTITQFENDPLKAALAVQEFSSIVQEDANLQATFVNRYAALPKQ